MELQRYSKEELIDLGQKIFYDYMSSETDLFYDEKFDKLDEDCPTCAHQLHKYNENTIKDIDERIKIYENAIKEKGLDEECVKALETQMNYLNQEKSYLLNANKDYQKKVYEETKHCDYSRSAVRIPLDKKLNSYYDDLVLEIVFYDDVCGLGCPKFSEYCELTNKQDRLNFIKENTEVTHMGLSYFRNGEHKATIGILGNLNTKDPRIEATGVTLLDHKFCDFKNLTLKDTLEIKNNDLKQWIQSKIDMDKENLKKLSSQIIAGDPYDIVEVPTSDNGGTSLYIRYICRSTGRIYYNALVLRHLEMSPYYDKNDIDSYAKAWWNLNNLGTPIPEKAISRC